MGKLTECDDQGNWSLKGVKWKDLYVGMPITREVQEKLYGALWKLMEYERIGLDPEQVEQILEEGRSRMYKNHEGYPAPTEGEAIRRASRLPKHIWNPIKLAKGLLDKAKLDVVEITVRDRKTKQKYTWEE